MKQIIFASLLLATSVLTKAQTIATQLAGRWLTEDKTVVSFYPCQNNWCASQIDAVKEADKKFNGKMFAKNIIVVSDKELKGTVINPENGKEYDAKWTVSADGKTLSLKVKWGFLSFNEKWVKQ